MWAISATARSNASAFAWDGFVDPLIFRTYWKRRGLDLVVGRRRLEIVKGVDVPAHAGMLAPAHARIQR